MRAHVTMKTEKKGFSTQQIRQNTRKLLIFAQLKPAMVQRPGKESIPLGACGPSMSLYLPHNVYLVFTEKELSYT